MPTHRFTLEEAQALLPRLASMLQELQTLKTQHGVFQAKAAELGTKMKGNGRLLDQELKQTQDGMEKTAGAINEVIAKVHELGCEVKDLDMGLVDFRAEHEGREVYLCWKLGEERISWWHDLDTGFASRRPLD
jgi:hypothetical protein